VGLFVVSVGLGVPTAARAQETCDEDLATARARYTEGRFEESTGLVLGCLNGGRLVTDDGVPAYRLLVLGYLQGGDEAAAKRALVRLLVNDPAYEPDYVQDPPAYRTLVRDVKRALELPSAADVGCAPELAEADRAYVEGAYERALRVLGDCLGKPALGPAVVAQANRLLALTQLKQGDLTAARIAVLEILAVAPEYRADPVQDVPAYVSLVNVVRQQVDEDAAP
jgi:hypothetical protein